MSPDTDEALMERFCEGDTKALEVLFERHAVGVHAFLRRMVRDGALADDLLQATFLSVVRSRDRYRRGAPVKPWLITIAANAARDSLRRANLNVEVLGEELHVANAPADDAEPSDPAVRRRIEAAFAALPVQQREAVLLHKVNGFSFEQIADALDITSSAARIRAHRGYARLRELLGDLAP